MALNVVLYEPEIPANTGNIGRTCVATGSRLHLIEPLGFRLGEKELRRAGMDYWKDLDVSVYMDYDDFLERNPGARIYMATTKAPNVYTDVRFEPDCYLMFGKESAGIPEELPAKTSGGRHTDSDESHDPFSESFQFGCGRAVRSAETAEFCPYAADRKTDRMRVGFTMKETHEAGRVLIARLEELSVLTRCTGRRGCEKQR